MTSKLEQALQHVKEKDVFGKQTVQELQNCQTELDELKNSFKTVSDELKRVNTEVGKITKYFMKSAGAVLVKETLLDDVPYYLS